MERQESTKFYKNFKVHSSFTSTHDNAISIVGWRTNIMNRNFCKYLGWSSFAKIVNKWNMVTIFSKKVHRRCLTGTQIQNKHLLPPFLQEINDKTECYHHHHKKWNTNFVPNPPSGLIFIRVMVGFTLGSVSETGLRWTG